MAFASALSSLIRLPRDYITISIGRTNSTELGRQINISSALYVALAQNVSHSVPTTEAVFLQLSNVSTAELQSLLPADMLELGFQLSLVELYTDHVIIFWPPPPPAPPLAPLASPPSPIYPVMAVPGNDALTENQDGSLLSPSEIALIGCFVATYFLPLLLVFALYVRRRDLKRQLDSQNVEPQAAAGGRKRQTPPRSHFELRRRTPSSSHPRIEVDALEDHPRIEVDALEEHPRIEVDALEEPAHRPTLLEILQAGGVQDLDPSAVQDLDPPRADATRPNTDPYSVDEQGKRTPNHRSHLELRKRRPSQRDIHLNYPQRASDPLEMPGADATQPDADPNSVNEQGKRTPNRSHFELRKRRPSQHDVHQRAGDPLEMPWSDPFVVDQLSRPATLSAPSTPTRLANAAEPASPQRNSNSASRKRVPARVELRRTPQRKHGATRPADAMHSPWADKTAGHVPCVLADGVGGGAIGGDNGGATSAADSSNSPTTGSPEDTMEPAANSVLRAEAQASGVSAAERIRQRRARAELVGRTNPQISANDRLEALTASARSEAALARARARARTALPKAGQASSSSSPASPGSPAAAARSSSPEAPGTSQQAWLAAALGAVAVEEERAGAPVSVQMEWLSDAILRQQSSGDGEVSPERPEPPNPTTPQRHSNPGTPKPRWSTPKPLSRMRGSFTVGRSPSLRSPIAAPATEPPVDRV